MFGKPDYHEHFLPQPYKPRPNHAYHKQLEQNRQILPCVRPYGTNHTRDLSLRFSFPYSHFLLRALRTIFRVFSYLDKSQLPIVHS